MSANESGLVNDDAFDGQSSVGIRIARCFPNGRLEGVGAIQQRQPEALQVGASHLHPGEASTQGGHGMPIRAPHPREFATNLGDAPVQPAFVDFLIRIDLDRSEVPIPQHGKSLLAFESQQSIRPVDVGRPRSARRPRIAPECVRR